jgi:hypothetical protein
MRAGIASRYSDPKTFHRWCSATAEQWIRFRDAVDVLLVPEDTR